MGMIKLLAFGLLVWIFWTLWRKFQQSVRLNKPRAGESSNHLKMVVCVVCQTHVPESEAIVKDHQTYCCIEHIP